MLTAFLAALGCDAAGIVQKAGSDSSSSFQVGKKVRLCKSIIGIKAHLIITRDALFVWGASGRLGVSTITCCCGYF